MRDLKTGPSGLDERPFGTQGAAFGLDFASNEALLKRSALQAKRSLSEALL